MKGIEFFLIALAAFLLIAGLPYIPALTDFPAVPGMWILTLATAATAVLLTKSGKSLYPLGSHFAIFWFLALVMSGIQFLGGLEQPLNLVPLVTWAVLQGVLANPFHALVGLFLLLLSLGVQLAFRVFDFLPGLSPRPIADMDAWLTGTAGPVALAVTLNLVLLGARRIIRTASTPPSTPPPPSGPPLPPPVPSMERAEPTPATRASGFVEAAPEKDAAASQYYSRTFLENLDAKTMQDKQDKQDTLEEVVYFMSRNFKARTSIAFLLDPGGKKLTVNAVVTKSPNFKYDCVIEVDQGLIGSAMSKPAGFVTGNLKSYGQLEYYAAPENINSIMAIRVMDIQTQRPLGLLVVDSENVRAFTDEHKTLMDRFTRIASALITSTNLRIQMQGFALQADNQYEIAKNLSQALRSEDVFTAMADALKRTFQYQRILICGVDPQTGRGLLWKIHGDPGKMAPGLDFDLQDARSVYAGAFRNRQAVVVQGFRAQERFIRFRSDESPADRPEDMLLAPILDERQTQLGVVGVEIDRTGAYSQTELQALKTIMANVSSALTKARMYQEMENLAAIDGLTQIPNHRKFQEFLNAEMGRCQRYHAHLVLLMLDIDHFKKFNDTYGHPTGDLVLKNVARAVEHSIRASDFCARYGGEEFVVALREATEAQAVQLAERIREAVERNTVEVEGKPLRVTVSIGGAAYPADASGKQELVDNADKAMYFSKKNGRNRVTFFSQIRKLPAAETAGA